MIKHLIWLCLIPLGSHSLAQNPQPLTLEVLEAQQKVEVYCGAELFTAYRYDKDLEKPVLFPVNAPGAIALTRGFPLEPRAKERTDHPHHVGLWFNYGDVNGFDFWNNSRAVPEERKANYGRIVHQEILEATSVKNRGILKLLPCVPTTQLVRKMMCLQSVCLIAFSPASFFLIGTRRSCR